MNHLRAALVAIAAICFGLGISLPLMTFERLVFFRESPSLLGIIGGLWEKDDIILALVIAIFSVLFPIAKIALSLVALVRGRDLPAWTGAIAKWSMMDVLLVALVVFAAKTSGLATAVTQPGLWFYGASTLLLGFSGLVPGTGGQRAKGS